MLLLLVFPTTRPFYSHISSSCLRRYGVMKQCYVLKKRSRFFKSKQDSLKVKKREIILSSKGLSSNWKKNEFESLMWVGGINDLMPHRHNIKGNSLTKTMSSALTYRREGLGITLPVLDSTMSGASERYWNVTHTWEIRRVEMRKAGFGGFSKGAIHAWETNVNEYPKILPIYPDSAIPMLNQDGHMTYMMKRGAQRKFFREKKTNYSRLVQQQLAFAGIQNFSLFDRLCQALNDRGSHRGLNGSKNLGDQPSDWSLPRANCHVIALSSRTREWVTDA